MMALVVMSVVRDADGIDPEANGYAEGSRSVSGHLQVTICTWIATIDFTIKERLHPPTHHDAEGGASYQ